MLRGCTVAVALLLAACAPSAGPVPAAPGPTAAPFPGLQATAAAQATAIVAEAQATALVLRAQAQAAALVQSAGAEQTAPAAVVDSTPPDEVTRQAPGKTPVPGDAATQQAADKISAPVAARATSAPLPAGGAELRGVGLAADGAMIIVRFRSTPKATERWYQGTVSVQDEQTGMLYNEIPTMPIIGPLFQRPRRAGDSGYVMLVNPPPGVRAGSVVTVVLGDFRQEHVVVQP